MITPSGKEMYEWAKFLWPISRSLTGQGVRDTLAYLKKLLPDLELKEVSSGTKAFDWTVPEEWNIRQAYITDDQGNIIIDFKNNNSFKFLDLSTLQFVNNYSNTAIVFPHDLLNKSKKVNYESVDSFFKINQLPKDARIIAIGPSTQRRLAELNIQSTSSHAASFMSMIDGILC